MANRNDTALSQAHPFLLVRSRRKSLTLIVRPDNLLEVRCPLTMPQWRIERFVQEKADWIDRKLRENQTLIPIVQETTETEAQAHRLVHERIVQLAGRHRLPAPKKIMIRDLVSRWGSCSSHGTISINRRCARLPEPLIDYIILHEFCHLSELNHGPAFWQLLSQYLPDAKKRRRLLRQYRLV